jgi:membrane associated rhomboid family serine protease
MLPVREVRDRLHDERRLPAYVTFGLLAVNVVAFLVEQAVVGAGNRTLALQWGLVPRAFDDGNVAHGLVTVVTSMFLHAGWFHLLGNLWFLWIFGPSVEDTLGHLRFAALYLLGGAAAAAVHVAIDPASSAPMLGASGAIGAVLAAYVSLFPLRRITTIIPIIVIPLVFSVPAVAFVVEWFAINLFRGLGALELGPGAASGVAWWAHIGGFLSGLFLVRLLFPRHHDEHDVDADGRPIDGGDVVVRGVDGKRYLTSRGEDDLHEAE